MQDTSSVHVRFTLHTDLGEMTKKYQSEFYE